MSSIRDEWLSGWDMTPGIVSIHAQPDGRVTVWRRIALTGELVREAERFRPWLLLEHLADVQYPGSAPVTDADTDSASDADIRHCELNGPGELRHLVSARDSRTLVSSVLRGASRRLGTRVADLRDLGQRSVLSLPLEEQYLVATGRTYFRDLPFDSLHRLQFDLETTGLDARRDRIFMISVRYPAGDTEVLEAGSDDDLGEAELIRTLMDRVRRADPDVIENHNLQGFDLPFLDRRARMLGVALSLGRIPGARLSQRAARRGAPSSDPNDRRRVRFIAPGRELIDTMDAVRRHDFSTRDFPGHGLKAVAKHLGFAAPDREYVRGDQIYATYRTDPERIRRYATDDVEEVAALSRMLGGAAYALAQMVPRRYERLSDAGAATGVLDPLLIRAYLRSGEALPAHRAGDGTTHSGAALHLFASGVAHHVVKADVASLYPSLMRQYRIGPSRDRLGVMLALVDGLVQRRLEAKARARTEAPGSAERHSHEAMSAALKIVVNSAYGYMGAGDLTRFADVHAANEVTRRGREVLALMCRELAARGVTLLEADTDGVYFAVPEEWDETDERRVVSEVAALLPPLVQLEFEGRYAAMLSHEPKNYALLAYDGRLTLRGVAFRSSRSEPFGDAFLRQAIARALVGDVVGVRDSYTGMISALRERALPTYDVSSRVRLTKSPAEYLKTRAKRREIPYEALLASGQTDWSVGERIRVYRRQNGESGTVPSSVEDAAADDRRDYDVDYYVRLLRTSYAERLSRAFRPEDFATVFADAEQFSLFRPSIESVAVVLTQIPQRD
ncbi:MAG TPA: DNA polymerase domain-containing protein [Gemmatimonadaceae bacterium]